MPTTEAIFDDVIEKSSLGFKIENSDITSLTTSLLTSVKWFRNSAWNADHFDRLDAIIQRPGSATAADNVRYARDLDQRTGALKPDADWADGTLGSEYMRMLYYDIQPQLVYDSINIGKASAYAQETRAFSVFSDGDMASSATTAWTGASGATLSKVTTASRTMFRRALRVLNDSAGDYAQSSTVFVEPGSQFYVWAVASADVGTATLAAYDVTNGAVISSVSHSYERPMFMELRVTIPVTCEEFAVRLTGDGATDDIYWSALGGYGMNDSLIVLPSDFDEAFKVESLVSARFSKASLTSGVFDASSIERTVLPKNDYGLGFAYGEASPNGVQFHTKRHHGHPLLIQGRLDYLSTEGATTSEADITDAPFDLISALARVALLSKKEIRHAIDLVTGKEGDGDQRLLEAQWDLEDAKPRFVIEGPAKRAVRVNMGRLS